MTVLLVEQGPEVVLDVADRFAVLHHGRLVRTSAAAGHTLQEVATS